MKEKTNKTANKTYIFHVDGGHGWLAVKRKELIELGILDKISSCSYQKGKTVYLEEDMDYSTFVDANGAVSYKESYQDRSPIRSYENFRKE